MCNFEGGRTLLLDVNDSSEESRTTGYRSILVSDTPVCVDPNLWLDGIDTQKPVYNVEEFQPPESRHFDPVDKVNPKNSL